MNSNLNKQQLSAITHGEGPLLIIAGAGTGKTTVITERIVHLINSGLAKPEEILALTFTEKASQEMEERVDIALPLGYSQTWISTFHGFCDKILREKAIHIGLDPKFKLLTQAQSIKLVRDNIFKFDLDYFRPLGNPTKFIHGMLTHFSRLQDENIKPAEYLKFATDDVSKELASAYQFYDQLKIQKSYLDFGDLIVKTLELFEKRPNVLEEYKSKFKYILIDEFQDTNYSQNLLAMMLAAEKANITVVGDDDQSIYRFRGASVSNILEFKKNFPNAKTVVLNQNYRSFQGILDLSYKVIQNNNPDRLEIVEKINKKLVSSRKGKAEIGLLHTKTNIEEAEVVAEKIINLVEKGEYDFSDFAILVRANNHADSFIKTFERLGIPHQFLGPAKLFQQPEIIDLISYLRVLHDPHDDLSLTRFLSIKELEISGRKISDLSGKARKENKSLFELLDEIKVLEIINDHLERKYKEPAGNLLFEFIQKVGIYENLLKETSEIGVVKANNISAFFEKLKLLEEGTVAEAVDWVDLSLELGDSPVASAGDWSQENKVNILTIHSSKGLEFPVVFLVNLVNLRFPGTNRSEQIPIPEELIRETLPSSDFHLQEERRLFYVGVTRAKDKLFLTAADFYGDSVRAKKLSQFVLETELPFGQVVSSKKQAAWENPKPVLHSTSYILPTVVDRLSYSQIESFKICPLHYKLAYILRIPTPDSASLSLGTSVHETMLDIFTEIKNGVNLKKINFEEILNNNWINAGYLDKKHEQQSLKTSLEYINNYFVSVYKGEVPIALEEKFTIKLGPTLSITGKIDRIDELPDGTLEIIDYKTSQKLPTQKEVDNNLQLSIYALAAKQLYPDKKIKLSLFFFEESKKISTTRDKVKLKEAEQEIFDIRKQIEESDFTCSKHFFCENCEYSLFCKQENV